MRCSEALARAGRAARCVAVPGARARGVRRRRPGAQVERLVPPARRPARRARAALGHRPARPRRRPRPRRRRRRQAHLGRGPDRLAADRGLRDGASRHRRLSAQDRRARRSNGAATAPTRCCTFRRPAPCRRRRRSAIRSSPRSTRPIAASPRSSGRASRWCCRCSTRRGRRPSARPPRAAARGGAQAVRPRPPRRRRAGSSSRKASATSSAATTTSCSCSACCCRR